jgi:ATP-dependent DNA helicase RecG
MALDMERIDAGEDIFTEFKREYTEEIKKTIIAFANTKGGTLFIGINNDKTIAGVKDPEETLLQVTNVIRAAVKPDITMFVECRAEKVQKKDVVVVSVQKGTSCPYYLAGKGIRPEGVFVRQGASSVPASETAILNMIKETDGAQYEEARSLNQDLTFMEAQRFFKDKDVPFGAKHYKTLHLQTTDGIYTNLGLLLSDQSIHTVKLAVFEGLEKEVFKDRREFSGSLLKQLEDIYQYLDMYNHIHAEVKGLYRHDRRDYPEEALKEALLNVLVHRDYAYSSSTLISIFEDRMEFVSIGSLVKGISIDDIEMGVSVLRNEFLASVFYRLRLIEAYGTGIPKILNSYSDCARKPRIQVSSNAFKITLPNRNITVYNPEDSKISFSVHENRYFLYPKEKKIIILLEERGDIDRKDVEAALGVSQAMAVRYLRGLVEKGAIIAVGGGRSTRYTLGG